MIRRTMTLLYVLLILVGIAVAVPQMTSADSSEVPANSPRLLAASSVGVGGEHTCVAKNVGTVSCWGLQTRGRLGNGQTSSSTPVPSEVTGLTGVKAISSGSDHGCALLVEGTVRCWGRNDFRHLGDGTTTDRSTPLRVLASGSESSSPVELTGVTAISVGGMHTCGLMQDGTVKCWGNNGSRQLGNTGPTAPNNTVTVAGVSGAVGLATGLYFSCALLSDGTVKCWGSNSQGALGDGTTTTRTTPVRVLASGTEASSPIELTNVTAISANNDQACALMSDGSLRCWGANSQGQLGDGTTTNRLNPVRVLASGTEAATPVELTGAVSVTNGHEFSCALLSDSTARCWGRNTNGQLADGTTTNRLNPVRVLASGTEVATPVELTGIKAINASGSGSRHACTLMADTSMRCWGLNGNGQLGIGTTVSPKSNPEQVLTSLGGPALVGAGVTTTTTVPATTTTEASVTTVPPTTTTEASAVPTPGTTTAPTPDTATTSAVTIAATATLSTTAMSSPSASTIRSLAVGEIVATRIVEAGSSITIEAGGFTPSEDVSVGILSDKASSTSAVANSKGRVATRLSIPSDSPERITVFAYGRDSKHGYRQVVTVASAASLPATGSDSPTISLLAAVSLLIGISGLARRRLTRQSSFRL